MMVMTRVGRRAARWMAGLAAAACCVAGVALPAHAANEEPISLPQTAPLPGSLRRFLTRPHPQDQRAPGPYHLRDRG